MILRIVCKKAFPVEQLRDEKVEVCHGVEFWVLSDYSYWAAGLLGYWALSPRGYFEDCIPNVEEAENGWEEGCEFAQGNDLKE